VEGGKPKTKGNGENRGNGSNFGGGKPKAAGKPKTGGSSTASNTKPRRQGPRPARKPQAQS
jgi:ATP-dependent RNA helicase RhlE